MKMANLHFLWTKRTFALCRDSTFRRYNGAELRHSVEITESTLVSRVGDTEFTLTFTQPELHYYIRAPSSEECDQWVAALQLSI